MSAEKHVTVRYDLSPVEVDGVLRDKLIKMGWTPPAPSGDMTNRWKEVPPVPKAEQQEPVAWLIEDRNGDGKAIRAKDISKEALSRLIAVSKMPLYLGPLDLAAENARLNGRLTELEALARLHASLHVEHGMAKVRIAEQDTIIDELRTRLVQKMDDCTKAQQRIAELESTPTIAVAREVIQSAIAKHADKQKQRITTLTAALEKAREALKYHIEQTRPIPKSKETLTIINEVLTSPDRKEMQ